jgi:hypothetical protein
MGDMAGGAGGDQPERVIAGLAFPDRRQIQPAR